MLMGNLNIFLISIWCGFWYALAIYAFYLAVQQGGKKQLLLALNWLVLLYAPIVGPIICYLYHKKDKKNGKG
jgi:hypothetical protein